MKEIRLYKSPWKAIKLILLCSIFVLGGIWLLAYTDAPKWIGWLNISFFSLGYPTGLFHLFDRRPQIIINEIGIFDRTTHVDFINWAVIKDAYPINIHGQRFICLLVDEQFRPSKKKGKFYQASARFSEAIGAQELNISLGQIKADENKLMGIILTVIHSSATNMNEQQKTGIH